MIFEDSRRHVFDPMPRTMAFWTMAIGATTATGTMRRDGELKSARKIVLKIVLVIVLGPNNGDVRPARKPSGAMRGAQQNDGEMRDGVGSQSERALGKAVSPVPGAAVACFTPARTDCGGLASALIRSVTEPPNRARARFDLWSSSTSSASNRWPVDHVC
ncbi:MAG: hypothetical protein AAFR70_07845 [Pseudomonadota bacterium]